MSQSQLKPEIETLREVLASLQALLEPSEEFRALRQLDDRERGGSPLQSIDGVLFRGRLVRRLEESNCVWRAYVRIEAAIAHLEGSDKLEPSLVGGRDTVSKTPAGPIVAPALRPAGAAATVASGPMPPPASTHGTIASSTVVDAAKLNGQTSPPAACVAPQHASANRATAGWQTSDAPHAGREAQVPIAPAIPVVPSRMATPSPTGEENRTVLDRIRLVPNAAGKAGAATDAAGAVRDAIGSGRLTDPLPPAIDDATSAKPAMLSDERSGREASMEITARLAAPVEARAHGVAGQSPSSGFAGSGPGSTTRAATSQQSSAPANPMRLDELESELARLIQHNGAARFPGWVTGAAESEGPEPQFTSLEPDIGDNFGPDADVEEAEVTIIRLAEPGRDGAIKPSLPAATPTAKPKPAAEPSPSAAPRQAGPSTRRSELSAETAVAGNNDHAIAADGDTDAPSADVEEADVEIIVPSRGASKSGDPGATSRRKPD